LKDALEDNDLIGILWSLDSLDWNELSGDRLVERVVSNVEFGDIFLFPETSSMIPGSCKNTKQRQGFKTLP
jgi:hypothetical protein